MSGFRPLLNSVLPTCRNGRRPVCMATYGYGLVPGQLLGQGLHDSHSIRFYSSHDDHELYPGHVPSSPLQKAVLAGGSALMALADPWRADMVAVNGEVTGLPALKYMLQQLEASEEGRAILRDRPRLSRQVLHHLQDSPPHTVGGTYHAFMARHKLDPDSRERVRFVDDPDLAYVMTRYRETHDLTHAMLGLSPNMVGEVLVKVVEGLQTRLPMCVGGAIFGPIRFKGKQREQYQDLLPWAINVGLHGGFLPGVYYEQRWEQPIEEFRRELNIQLHEQTQPT